MRRTISASRRFKQRSGTTTIFVVDASGSRRSHRLAEAKGAVELLLADCYVRRDQVALIAFRGRGAEMLLPPTRSLARAKRSLAGAAGRRRHAARRRDRRGRRAGRRGPPPAAARRLVVLLTDGRANIARDGTAGRAAAETDALDAARAVR